ncbi:hypothetical protein M427DRAFT_51682 [Gonapodya prolifera JEL478]|uniref:Xylanolytic transcriptional activator regulatory domain-containing protein n=1 Tax=Gonapodya prolifera (strain JEL478) TaxID=1344416 RepID=A0A139AVE7_GONPJ|nr:hypothetical protein M427DRAFT_51682 [Gonapodya prolifera JEL478]|eukprot:KXS20702.1 hypothetical protein M427DRAFT_51682 [Gonapodya prolifera JEL478]
MAAMGLHMAAMGSLPGMSIGPSTVPALNQMRPISGFTGAMPPSAYPGAPRSFIPDGSEDWARDPASDPRGGPSYEPPPGGGGWNQSAAVGDAYSDWTPPAPVDGGSAGRGRNQAHQHHRSGGSGGWSQTMQMASYQQQEQHPSPPDDFANGSSGEEIMPAPSRRITNRDSSSSNPNHPQPRPRGRPRGSAAASFRPYPGDPSEGDPDHLARRDSRPRGGGAGGPGVPRATGGARRGKRGGRGGGGPSRDADVHSDTFGRAGNPYADDEEDVDSELESAVVGRIAWLASGDGAAGGDAIAGREAHREESYTDARAGTRSDGHGVPHYGSGSPPSVAPSVGSRSDGLGGSVVSMDEGRGKSYRPSPRRAVVVPPPLTPNGGDAPVIMPLITLFFSHVYPILPFIHRSSFYEKLIPHNQHHHLLLNSIYAVSARFSTDPTLLSSAKRPYEAGDTFFTRAQALLAECMNVSTVPTTQALLLLSLHAFGRGRFSQGWLYSGMAIRMAQELKMNVDYEDLPGLEKGVGWIERETRRRVWWSCFALDRQSAAAADRPYTIDEQDCHLSLPSDETIWEHTNLSFQDDDGLNLFQNSRLPRMPFSRTLPYQPPGPSSPPLSHFALNTILVYLFGKILRLVGHSRKPTQRPTQPFSRTPITIAAASQGVGLTLSPTGQGSVGADPELGLLDASLRNWYRGLPPELTHPHLSGHLESVWIGAYLQIYYHAAMIVLHRPVAHYPSQPSGLDYPYGLAPPGGPKMRSAAPLHLGKRLNGAGDGEGVGVGEDGERNGRQPNVRTPPPGSSLKQVPVWPTPLSRDICTSSAERVAKIIQDFVVPNPWLNRFNPFAAYCMFHSGVVHMINLIHPYEVGSVNSTSSTTGLGLASLGLDTKSPEELVASSRLNLKSHIMGLRRMGNYWGYALRYLEALEGLLRATGLEDVIQEAKDQEEGKLGDVEIIPTGDEEDGWGRGIMNLGLTMFGLGGGDLEGESPDAGYSVEQHGMPPGYAVPTPVTRPRLSSISQYALHLNNGAAGTSSAFPTVASTTFPAASLFGDPNLDPSLSSQILSSVSTPMASHQTGRDENAGADVGEAGDTGEGLTNTPEPDDEMIEPAAEVEVKRQLQELASRYQMHIKQHGRALSNATLRTDAAAVEPVNENS